MKIWRIAFTLFVAFSLVACEKADPFEETDSGKNTLGFMLNGKKVEYFWQPVMPPAVYMDPVWAREYSNDTLEIYASLESIAALGGHNSIAINLPVKKLTNGAVLVNQADIILSYLAGSEPVEDYTRLYYNSLDITTSRVSIRTCKPGEVLSGTFEFEGDAEFRDGTTQHCRITNGHFDVKWEKYQNTLMPD